MKREDLGWSEFQAAIPAQETVSPFEDIIRTAVWASHQSALQGAKISKILVKNMENFFQNFSRVGTLTADY